MTAPWLSGTPSVSTSDMKGPIWLGGKFTTAITQSAHQLFRFGNKESNRALHVQYVMPVPRIGCSGWEYKHWRGDFYPAAVPKSRWFELYADTFDTVEINNTFYRLPEKTTFTAWSARAPAGFLYAVKASRFLTHMKKLKDPEEPLSRLFSRMDPLRDHLGPVLYQLPPGWKLDYDRLEYFLQALPTDFRHVLEFRDPSWYADGVLALLDRYDVALCLHDMRGSATGRERIGPFVYVRFHGATGHYGGGYSDRRLREWADWLRPYRRDIEIYAYFNNDVGGHAPRNALTLRRMMEELDD